MDEAYLLARRQRASDYLLGNERLTRELTDDQARVLLDWASQQTDRAAADRACSDQELDSLLQAVRRAVRHVARTSADEHDPARLMWLAERALADGTGQEPGAQ
jgi:hypothetical protein